MLTKQTVKATFVQLSASHQHGNRGTRPVEHGALLERLKRLSSLFVVRLGAQKGWFTNASTTKKVALLEELFELNRAAQADAFAADGAVHLRGLFTDWIDELAAGVAHNEARPSEVFDDNGTTDET